MSSRNKQLKIGGMFCSHCQVTIERSLRGLDGVQTVSVRYQTGDANITYDPGRISLEQIKQKIEALGYEVVVDTPSEISRTISLLVIILALYVILQQAGVLNRLVPSQLAESSMGYGMMFLVGLITSVHCIAMCGGINLSQCLPRENDDTGNLASAIMPAIFYNLGRIISYTAIGFFLGLVGLLIGGGSEIGPSTLLQGILKLVVGAFMVIMGVNMLGIFPWLRRLALRPSKFLTTRIGIQKAKAKRPLVVGLLNGFMPCGPLQSMQILALASGSPVTGAISMMLFSLGTVPLMLGLGTLVSALGRQFSRAVMNVGAVLVAVLGLAMIAQGGAMSGMLLPNRLLVLVVGLAVVGVVASLRISRRAHRLAVAATSVMLVLAVGLVWQRLDHGRTAVNNTTVQVVDGVQFVNSTLEPGQYPTIMVQAGLPVRWTIHAPEDSVNGCNYRMIIQEYGIEYAFTEGENLIEFTPTDAGTFSYTCWMGMIRGSIIVT